VAEKQPQNEHIYWNKRQKKSILPALVGLILLCMILAYMLSHTAS